MDHPPQPIPALTVDLTSVQSALAHLREITDPGDGRQANAFMATFAVLGQGVPCTQYPNWFGRMTPFMCAEYARIHDMNNYRKMRAFERAYEVEAGELGPEGVYSAVLMPVLKVTSNGAIVSDWEARPNSGMVDEWESDDEGEEEGRAKQIFAKFKLQADLKWVPILLGGHDLRVAAGNLCSADPPPHVADLGSFWSGDRPAYSRHDRNLLGIRRKKIVAGSVFEAGLRHMGISCKIKKQAYFNLENGKSAQRNVARSEESIALSKEVADDDAGMFQEHFKENLRWKLSNSSSSTYVRPAQLHQFRVPLRPGGAVRLDRCSCLLPCTKNTWTSAHIQWVMKSIWFCDKTSRLSRVTGIDASILRRQRTTVFKQIRPFVWWFCHLSIRENTVCSPTFQRDLSNVIGEYADTGPSDEEGNDDEDMGYGAAQSPAHPMDVDPIASEGETGRSEVGEEWRVASETRADSAAAQAAATLAGLVAYGTSSDDASGDEKEEEEEEKKAEGEEDKTSDADDEREKEQEQEQEEQLHGGEASDSAPKSKGEVFLSPPRAQR
ncbi:hypothetical protein ARMGADRAFT_1038717 [Armillaria gallica]|uniref:Uncharacterized protein n=1 Tax=Armillaria gallica TaxID=47427 RepID=A0A2H3CTB2_ARMGA|nr:hypothetical protein ARMGADRAFT_1038717 [Armillaria gallica]